MLNMPPMVPTIWNPEKILAADLGLFWEMADWIRKNIGREKTVFDKAYSKKYNFQDREWFREKLNELAEHGFHLVETGDGQKWMTRVKAPMNLEFEGPELERLKELPVKELRKSGIEYLASGGDHEQIKPNDSNGPPGL